MRVIVLTFLAAVIFEAAYSTATEFDEVEAFDALPASQDSDVLEQFPLASVSLKKVKEKGAKMKAKLAQVRALHAKAIAKALKKTKKHVTKHIAKIKTTVKKHIAKAKAKAGSTLAKFAAGLKHLASGFVALLVRAAVSASTS